MMFFALTEGTSSASLMDGIERPLIKCAGGTFLGRGFDPTLPYYADYLAKSLFIHI